MISLDSLLAPLSETAPCGTDPSATGVLIELETAILGRPETQFSAREEPDWKALKIRTLEVAATAKDLRIAGILAATLLRTDGLSGLRDGIQLARGYLERYWGQVFPLLDVAEKNDPSERINAVANLAAPLGTDGDLLRVVSGLRTYPLLSAVQAGRFTLQHYLGTKGSAPFPQDAGQPPTPELLDAALKEADKTAVKENVQNARAILADLAAIEKTFKDNAGPSLYPTFEPLRQELKHVIAWLGPGTPDATDDAVADGGNGARTNNPVTEPGISGQVRNRADVARAIDAIIAYYQNTEPSSPVPFLLRRVQRIVNMNFIQLITELTPDALERIVSVTGPLGENAPPKA